MNQRAGFVAILLTAAIFGTFGLLVRTLADSFSDSGQVLARFLFATLIIVAILMWKKGNPFKFDKQNGKYIVLFSLAFPLSVLAFTYSANSIKVANSVFMLYVGSLIATALFSTFLFKEKFTPKHLVSLGLVVVGLCFFVFPFTSEVLSLGLIIGIIGGLFSGWAHALRKLMRNLQREIIVFYQSFSGVVLGLIFVILSQENPIKNLSIQAVLVAIIFGALFVVIGYLLAFGFANTNVNTGTIVLTTELFFAMVVAAIFLSEFPTAFELIGGLLIFGGSVLSGLDLNKQKPETKVDTTATAS